MKRLKLLLLFLSLFGVISAQTNIWVEGYVYTEENGKQNTMPFASISVYDYGTDNLVYYTLSGTFGNYIIKPYDHSKQYRFVVEVPGYKQKSFNLKAIPEVLNGKPFSGNRTLNVEMEKSDEPSIDISKMKKYTVTELAGNDDVKNFNQLMTHIDGVKKEGNDWVTVNDGSIALCLNGNVMQPEMVSKIEQLPLSAIDFIEYYPLSSTMSYEGAINIVLNMGRKATAPTYTMKECELVF